MCEELPKAYSTERPKFSFSKPIFDGRKFYDKYKTAEFLKEPRNILHIFARYYELKNFYDDLPYDEEFEMDGMFLEPDVPLVLKKSRLIDESDLNQDDFTLRRLTGFLAAYVLKFKTNFTNIYCEEVASVTPRRPKLFRTAHVNYFEYLAAVSGAELFVKEFSFYPFLVALRRYELKEISQELLQNIADIQHPETKEPLISLCSINKYYRMWDTARVNYQFNLRQTVACAPPYIRRLCVIPDFYH